MYITTAGAIDLSAATGPGSRYDVLVCCHTHTGVKANQSWDISVHANIRPFKINRTLDVSKISICLRKFFLFLQFLLVGWTAPRCRYRLNPRCQEWEELMDADFHGGWTEMEEIHSSDKQWNTALNAKMAEPQTNGA